MCIALYIKEGIRVSVEKNFIGDSGGIRTYDLLLQLVNTLLTSRPPSLLDDD